METLIDFLFWIFLKVKATMTPFIGDFGDNLDPLSCGCIPLAKGWYPDGAEGTPGRLAYQKQLAIWQNVARSHYEPIFKKDPNYFYRLGNQIGDSYGLPKGIIGAILRHESGGKPWAMNFGSELESTAVGLGQLVYTTARGLKSYHTFQAVENLKAISQLMKANLDRCNGNLDKALQSYAGNPQTTLLAFYQKYGQTPQYFA